MSTEIKTDTCRGALMSVSLDKYIASGMEIEQIIKTLRQARNEAYAPIDYLLSLRYDCHPSMAETIRKYENRHDDIFETFKGIDFVGNERQMFENDLKGFVEPWLNKRKIIRAHVGEYGDETHIAYAVKNLNITRIAHGICIKSRDLIWELIDKEIPLDVCISSNYLTGNVRHLSDHPLKRLLSSGLRLTLGTDDPTVFNTDMSKELRYCEILLDKDFLEFYMRICNEAY